MSPRAGVSKGITLERLDRFNRRSGEWREALVEDRTAGPAQIAETRLDFADWLQTLPNRERQLAEKLALGETTGCVARAFRISAGRVSQLRRDLCENWRRFVGELAEVSGDGVIAAAC
jgi:FixJ family two-component response regulator